MSTSVVVANLLGIDSQIRSDREMKFNSCLSDLQNKRIRRLFHSAQLQSKQSTDYADLSFDERPCLTKLNGHLKGLEEKYLPIINRKGKGLMERLANPADWLKAFNLELHINFHLREDDPEFDEDDENILMSIHEICFDYDDTQRNRDWGFGITSINYCHFSQHFEGESHCYLYHHLTDHCDLDWRDLLRIGSVWVDIKIDEQSGWLSILE